ncbi:hemerythrin domain-containing protein [Lederbergia panacisoli]|uniref:hemerythrin domain-containing protein n=1 Tax=Lederbergia panacisoli TaxID=1255251 RepID=UPI00214B8177|nr:hemerythrin domain-containing protein [Lederbergia panacisoli]MCR2821608.1 hemerythrin domain-containing protein [Lederbergia panacisoli]
MSGPSLRKLDAHRAIHDGSFIEAKNLTDLLYKLVGEERDKEAMEVADALVEHWELRVITHADSEEQGFYKEVVEKEPKMLETIAMLTRDHDLIRILAERVRGILKKDGVTKEVLESFTGMLIVNEIHSRDEERLLLDHEHDH